MISLPDTQGTGPGGSNLPPQTVFEAPFTGVYAFVVVDGGAGSLSNSGGEFPKTIAGHGQTAYLVFLNAEDVVQYSGDGGQLAGVRLGDELSE